MTTNLQYRKPILVLGVGNLLQADDGVGVHVIDAMKESSLPENVELLDGGTAGVDLLSIINNRQHLIVVDAVDADMEPGTIFRFTPGDISQQSATVNSLHQIGLLESLQLSGLEGSAPENTVIIGVQPAVVDWGMSLSDCVRSKLPKVIDVVKTEIEKALRNVEPSKDEP